MYYCPTPQNSQDFQSKTPKIFNFNLFFQKIRPIIILAVTIQKSPLPISFCWWRADSFLPFPLSQKRRADPEDEERESYLKWLGREYNPEFFDLHELQNRVDDFQRVIGEARWGFYHR